VTKKKRSLRARTQRREQERSHDKLALARRKLLGLERGGAPERPIDVDSAAVIEARAESVTCPDCSSALRTVEHKALQHGGQLLRVVELACRSCGAALNLYFRIGSTRLN
jgi:hypothetical protein